MAAERRAYVVGGEVAGLASAASLIRDGGFRGQDIHVLERSDRFGGSLDGAGDAASGFVIRGGRMFEEHSACAYDLFDGIPSLADEAVSIRDEIHAFTRLHSSRSKSRLVFDRGASQNILDRGRCNSNAREVVSLTHTSHCAVRFALIRSSRADLRAAVSRWTTSSPVPKNISFGVCPWNAESLSANNDETPPSSTITVGRWMVNSDDHGHELSARISGIGEGA